MDIEKYTERARGFIQAAQSLAMREGHQQFSSLHVLKVLLDDSEGLAAGLIDRAGGSSRAILKATEGALNKLPKVRSIPRRKSPRRRATVLSPSSGFCWDWRSRKTARPDVSCETAASRRKTSTRRSKPCARAAPLTVRRLKTPTMR